jgi:disulfide bond formation protein DsbB
MPAHRLFSLIVLLAAVAVLGAALASQYWGGLRPCVLCLYQRYPYAVVIALMVAAGFGNSRIATILLVASGLAFLVGAGIGAYHVGVEQHWWVGTAECGSTDSADTVEALKAKLLGRAPVRCDEVAWSLFGISMAGYNVLTSLGLAGFAGWAARRLWKARGS